MGGAKRMTVRQLAEQVAALQARLETLESANREDSGLVRKRLAKLETGMKGVKGLSRRLETAAGRLDKIDPHAVEQTLDSLHEVAANLRDRYQLMVLQWATAAEVERLIRVEEPKASQQWLASTLIRAFDMPPAWWQARRKNTLEDWVVDFSKLAVAQAESDTGVTNQAA